MSAAGNTSEIAESARPSRSRAGLSLARRSIRSARLRSGTGEASRCAGGPVAGAEFTVGDDEWPLRMGQPVVRLPGRCPGR
jgi:hypothetical protein